MMSTLTLLVLWALFEPRSFGGWIGSILVHIKRGAWDEVAEDRKGRTLGELAWAALGIAFAIVHLIATYGVAK